MADLASKSNPEDLKHEHPDYVENVSGVPDDTADDSQPSINVVHDPGSLGVHKPTVSLDDEAVAKAEREGKGFAG